MKQLLITCLLLLISSVSGLAQSNPPLTIREVDGNPKKTNTRELIVPNGSLTVSGSRVTFNPNGGLVVGTTSITSGTIGRFLYHAAGDVVNEVTGVTFDGTNVTAGSNNLRATSPRFTTGINDANGNELFILTATGSAVNEFTITNAATGNSPAIIASGSDSNVDITLSPKGTGDVHISNGNSDYTLYVYGSRSGSNYNRIAVIGGGNYGAIQLQTSPGDANVLYIGNTNTAGGSNVQIQTSSTSRYHWDVNGNFLASTDNVYDIGSSSDLRPRTMYLGTSLIAPVINFASDTGLAKVAASVSKFTNGSSSLGWMQWAGEARVTANVTNNTTTFANITDLTINNIVSGRKYTGRMTIKCNNSVAAEGMKFDFNGGSATVSAFWAAVGSLATGGVTPGTVISTALNGAMNFSVVTGETVFIIEFSFVASGNGTLIPRFAENSTSSGTATVEIGSYIITYDNPL